MDEMNEANRRMWNALADEWKKLRDQDGLWRKLADDPEPAFDGEALAMIQRWAGDLREKRALVIGSGDNYAAFALAGMGARVTSSDIAEHQLEVARERAKELGLEITFVQADATVLAGIPEGEFDLVVSSNGLLVWIAEPGRVFEQVFRVLKPGGFYIFYDVHPFMRPWKDQVYPLEMGKPYSATGPFVEDDPAGVNYQFNWRLVDLINPLLDAGLALRQIAESPAKDARFWEGHSYEPGKDAGLTDWRRNPRAGLPVWLSVAAQKPLSWREP